METGSIHDAGEGDKRREYVIEHDEENGGDEGHALDVADRRLVGDERGQQVVQTLVIGSVHLEEAQARERARHIQSNDLQARVSICVRQNKSN